ncbi:MAG: Type 1 glutamine amidotransferase-like domain-containing protein [Methanomassiliicoccaceae archaeon]|jgi:dipeptidase E|nr:Type 1 glutamine amidotransferase-like domain-containing protein [Methanomassiliicoccaceae archaeon]
MSRLFLSSYFSVAADLFPSFAGTDYIGKKVVFIPTAALNERGAFYISADRKALKKLGLIVEELEISSASYEKIKESISAADYIFIAGGNTFFLLQELKRKGADKLIVEEINKGKPYIGSSAGSAILSKDIGYVRFMDSPKAAPDLNGDFSSLSVIDFYIVPHYGYFFFKKAIEKTMKEFSDTLDLRLISNDQVIIVDGGSVETVTKKRENK